MKLRAGTTWDSLAQMTPDDIVDDLAADSLDTLILAIEDRFWIDIHDEDAAEILTVEQMIDYLTVALAMKQTVTSHSNTQRTVGLR